MVGILGWRSRTNHRVAVPTIALCVVLVCWALSFTGDRTVDVNRRHCAGPLQRWSLFSGNLLLALYGSRVLARTTDPDAVYWLFVALGGVYVAVTRLRLFEYFVVAEKETLPKCTFAGRVLPLFVALVLWVTVLSTASSIHRTHITLLAAVVIVWHVCELLALRSEWPMARIQVLPACLYALCSTVLAASLGVVAFSIDDHDGVATVPFSAAVLGLIWDEWCLQWWSRAPPPTATTNTSKSTIGGKLNIPSLGSVPTRFFRNVSTQRAKS